MWPLKFRRGLPPRNLSRIRAMTTQKPNCHLRVVLNLQKAKIQSQVGSLARQQSGNRRTACQKFDGLAGQASEVSRQRDRLDGE